MTLQEAIKSKGWTFRHASIMSGVTEQTLYRIVSGRFFPCGDTVGKLIDVFGCALEFVDKNGRWYTVGKDNDNS